MTFLVSLHLCLCIAPHDSLCVFALPHDSLSASGPGVLSWLGPWPPAPVAPSDDVLEDEDVRAWAGGRKDGSRSYASGRSADEELDELDSLSP